MAMLTTRLRQPSAHNKAHQLLLSTVFTTATAFFATKTNPRTITMPLYQDEKDYGPVSSTAKFEKPPLVNKVVSDYCLNLPGFSESNVAADLRLETAKHSKSVMMGDPTEAALLAFLLKLSPGSGKTVVEVGVFTGYTTLVLAEALKELGGGKIVGLDVNPDSCQVGAPFWKQAGVDDMIDMRYGPAVDSLQALQNDADMLDTVDLAFIDADKVNYQQYYELLLPLLKPGSGIIAIDNVLWSGKVADSKIVGDADTDALRGINEFVAQDPRVEAVLLPFADGVTLVRKKKQ
mmetsp:Transcript_23181/g.50404  ORF Transcript_23181/g.50404 Transcript_23181/m.50404 type:complete len:291 (-) Transcript_23181:513-1385(-)